MNVPSPCPSPEQWPKLIKADGPREELEAFAVHLEQCLACQQRWEADQVHDPLCQLLRNLGQVPPVIVDQRMIEVMDRLMHLPEEQARKPSGLTTKDLEKQPPVSTVDGGRPPSAMRQRFRRGWR